MSDNFPIKEIIKKAEDLKCDIWAMIDYQKRAGGKLTCQGVKDTMNELLDLLDSMADERVWL